MRAFINCFWLFVLLITPLSGWTQVNTQVPEELIGSWLVKVHNNDKRLRLLQVVSFTPEETGKWKAELRYSFINNQPKPIADAQLLKFDDTYQLTFITQSNSTVITELNKSGVFSGRFTNNKKEFGVDISPLTEDEFVELKNQEVAKLRQLQLAKLVITPSTKLELIYLESGNYACPYCQHWEKEYIRGGKLLDSDEGRNITITRLSTRGYISDFFLPENLRPHRSELESKARNLFRATPSFILMADDKPISWGVGFPGWDNRVYPALKQVVARKLGK